jgi:phosphatidylinositol alpha-1,6-mannosyltransferase
LKHWPSVRDKLTVITPGVDIERFRPAPTDAQVRQRLGWAGRRVVLTAGRLQMRKGHDCLIRALPAIRDTIPDVLYAIVGEGDRRDALQSLAAEIGVLDCVRFHGALGDDELIECYQQCDVLALPNREVNGDFEGFGMVLVEAQACGRPVLAGASGGTAETMRPGDTGWLVNCDKPEPLAQALVDALSDATKLDQFGAAGRRWAVDQFDWDALAARASKVFNSISDGLPRTARNDGDAAIAASSEAVGA